MNKGFKILAAMVLAVFVFAVANIFYYFLFIQFDNDYKKKLCERLNNEIESIQVEYEFIEDRNIDKEITINEGELLEDLTVKIRDICQGSYNKGLYARYSTTVIKCRIRFEDSDEIYLRVIGFESGEGYVEFHRGGWFSLIGAIDDDSEFTNTLISIY